MKSKKNIFKIEEELFSKEDFSEMPPADIVAYNELRSCADLFRMYEQGVLKLYPEFQRDIVWPPASQTRFIDSLIKSLPIPSMCFSYDAQKQEWLVIDGLQRIYTIVQFLKGGDWILSKTEDIDQNIAGVSVAKIKTSDGKLHKYYTQIENLTVPITVLRCNHSNKHHLSFLFVIFHRLNSEGMKLNNQEIRNCIYGGIFNRLLKELDETDSWRKINKMEKDKTYRFTKQELILRIFAFYEKLENYNGKLAKFLNEYMFENRNLKDNKRDQFKQLFVRTSDLIYKSIFDGKSPKKLSNAFLEALFIGVAKGIESLETKDPSILKRRYQALENNKLFSEEALSEGMARKRKVIDRIKMAIRILSLK